MDILNVSDCPGTIKNRKAPKYVEAPPGSGNVVVAGVSVVEADYAWLFSVDEHGVIGRRYISADNDPFCAIEGESPSVVAGYICKVNPRTGEVKYGEGGNPMAVSQDRLDSWIESDILVDPSDE